MPQRRQLSAFLEEKGYVNQSTRLQAGTYIHAIHINSARLALEKDRDSLYRNALIAYCGAFKMILSGNYSWAFVHSYYSIVYFYQALLAFNDISLCYDQGKPFSIKLTAGAQFKKEDGNTHKSIHALFKDEFNSDAEICSDIDGVTVCDWFEDMRNKVNYRTVPQQDPAVGYGLCEYGEADELRKKVSVYLEDLDVYAYAPDHAYVAYPLLLIRRIMRLYEGKGQKCSHLADAAFVKYLSDNIKDRKGQLAPILELINGIGI
jgi:hypothetical protein